MATAYQNRDLIAALPSVGLVMFLLIGGVREVRSLKPKYDEPVKLEILDVAEVPAPPPPEPPRLPPVKPVTPQPPQVQPPPVKAAPQQPGPQSSLPSATPAAPAMPAAPVAAPVAESAPPRQAEAPPAPPAPKANVEAEFVARIRAYLNSVKRYPTGREASLARPEGSVRIWFVLRRDGSLVEMGIEESSNSGLLDEAARKSVSRGSFPAFPEQFKPGEQQHKFVVDLQFKPTGG
ncbi:TonB family protein [Herbaspirillum sp. CF444]|uniref:TonB family protein n=1 Tax=Herbaspirillum sp. CF444 TaxID=1144319 RepID=UPI0002722D35|nr:TonB family protein [Herbaspirillum sp. CF444]EJL92242.1 TonB family protein [Herbaspirillum sp. CF444]